jgi:hypothetical protein
MDIRTNDHHERNEAHITVDGQPKRIPSGEYRVSAFKNLVGIPTDYELEKVNQGVFHPIADNADICVDSGEIFVGHVRQGGSS